MLGKWEADGSIISGYLDHAAGNEVRNRIDQ